MSSSDEITVPSGRGGGAFAYLRHRQIDWLPSGGLRWWLLALIVLGWAVEQYEALKVGPVLVYVLRDFDKTLTQWGYVGALVGLVYSAGALLLSRLSDRFGRRPLMIWPVACYAVISAAGAMAPTFVTLAATSMLGAFMMAGMNPAVHAASRDLTPRMGRAMVYAWVSLAFTVGALMSTLIAAQTLPIWPGWRPQYWIGSGLGVITAVVLFVFYRDLSSRVRGQVLEKQADASLEPLVEPDAAAVLAADRSYEDGRAVYRSARLWILSGTIVFWSLTYVSVSAYVPTFLAQHYGMAPAQAAAVTSWFWILFTMSVFLSGWLSDRLRVRKTITAFGGVTTGLCFIAGANLPLDTSAATLSLVWSATGFFAGFIYPAWCALYSETAENISPHGVGRAFGITASLAPLSGLTLNLGLPRVVEAFGWPTWMMFAGLCCFGVAVLVAFGHGPWWVGQAQRRALLASGT
ncbi:MAG TPA: MFS transporter [Pseudomonadales bacterium]|nr:MFS transporter [Pseudomonadales bacterium]